jgi:hypothetical protein
MDRKDTNSIGSLKPMGICERLRTQSDISGGFNFNSTELRLLYFMDLYKFSFYSTVFNQKTQQNSLQSIISIMSFNRLKEPFVNQPDVYTNRFDSDWVIIEDKDICLKRNKDDNKNAGNKDLHTKQKKAIN